MNELLIKHGYKAAGTCNCDGFRTHKYNKDEYQVRWRKGGYKFQVRKSGMRLTNWKPITEAADLLDQLHPNVFLSTKKPEDAILPKEKVLKSNTREKEKVGDAGGEIQG